MATSYRPFKGEAGTVKFSFVQTREAGAPIVPAYINNVEIHVIKFSDRMVESSMNEEFEDINSDLNKNYFGHRQEVSFSLINSLNIPLVEGTTKSIRRAIQEIIHMINLINMYPESYRLELQYRSNANYGTIRNAMFSGDFELLELSENSNIAQEIPLTFKSKTVSQPDFGIDADISDMIILEDDSSNDIVLVREDSTEENPLPLVLEAPAFNVTP